MRKLVTLLLLISASVSWAAGPCSDLFFSEYIEGGSNNKALEIYNPTNATIDLSDYTLYRANNGATTPSGTLQLNGMLTSGDVYVIGNPSATGVAAKIVAESDTLSSITYFNGDDALWLVNDMSGDTLDIFGVIGVDPGSSWTVGTGSTSDYTLVRKSTVTSGTKDWTLSATQWDVYPKDTTMHLGAHTSSCLNILPSVPCNDLFFSEYIEGGGNNKALEIYNPTSATINLSGYYVHLFSNGSATAAIVDTLVGSIASSDVFVLSASGSNTAISAASDTVLSYLSVAHFNGNDAVALINGTDTIDVIGQIGVDPGSSGWTVGSGTTKDYTLVRKITVNAGTKDWTASAAQWDVYNKDSTTFIGSHLSNCVAPSGPTVSFLTTSQTVGEGAGTLTINLPIVPTATTVETVKLYVQGGTGITTGDYTTSPAVVNDTITLTVAAGDSTSFDLTIVDDILQESSEMVTFTIASISSGLLMGTKTAHVVTITDNDTPIPTYNISDLKGLDSDYLPDSLGVECKIIGTVLGVNMQGTAGTSASFTVHNGTDGFGVYISNTSYVVTEGDQVRVIGDIGHFNGLAQMIADSLVFISAGNPLPTPVVFTDLNESMESQLGRFNNAEIIDVSQWTNQGSGFNVDITNGTDTIEMRVDKDVDLFTQPAPVGKFDLIGIGGQYDSSPPHNSGYQFLPRYIADVVVTPPPTYPLAVTEIMSSSNSPNSAVNDDWWELTNYGSMAIDLAGFSWDDDSEQPGTVTFSNITIDAGESMIIWKGAPANIDAFKDAWGLQNTSTMILTSNDMTGSIPSLAQAGDLVVLYDTSANPVEICKAAYTNSTAGLSEEFDTNCTYIGQAQNGMRGAYTSTDGDVGSPGNQNVVGLDEVNLADVKIYPNPTNGLLTLSMPEGKKSINVINVTGASVLNITTSEMVEKIDLSSMPSGVYFVQIENKGQTVVKKVVKK